MKPGISRTVSWTIKSPLNLSLRKFAATVKAVTHEQLVVQLRNRTQSTRLNETNTLVCSDTRVLNYEAGSVTWSVAMPKKSFKFLLVSVKEKHFFFWCLQIGTETSTNSYLTP